MLINLLIPAQLDLLFIVLTVLVLFLTYKQQIAAYAKYGYLYTYYPWKPRLFFAPVYEELLFRGIIAVSVHLFIGFWWAIILSSLLFGLWHLRNAKYQPNKVTLWQCIYTGLLLGPLLAYLVFTYDTLYIAIMLHALNNYLSPISHTILKKIRLKI